MCINYNRLQQSTVYFPTRSHSQLLLLRELFPRCSTQQLFSLPSNFLLLGVIFDHNVLKQSVYVSASPTTHGPFESSDIKFLSIPKTWWCSGTSVDEKGGHLVLSCGFQWWSSRHVFPSPPGTQASDHFTLTQRAKPRCAVGPRLRRVNWHCSLCLSLKQK